jgi:predicted Zn-ribbon and HTH transcriptional regulator
MTEPIDLDAIQARCPVPGCTRETYVDAEAHTVDLYDHLNDVHGAAGVRALEHIARQQAARVRELEAELARLADVLKRTQALAVLDPATCESCGHLESAHDPDGDRDCNASAARIRSCTCAHYIACHPEPAPSGPTRPA